MSDTTERPSHPELLRRLADVLEAADLPGHVFAEVTGSGASRLDVFTSDRDELRAARRIVGKVEKREGGGGVTLLGHLDGVAVTIWPPAGTCTKVQVGTEDRPVLVESGEVEQVPVYEWDCGPVLAEVDA